MVKVHDRHWYYSDCLQIGPFLGITASGGVIELSALPSLLRTSQSRKRVWHGTIFVIALIPSSYSDCAAAITRTRYWFGGRLLFIAGEVRVIGAIPDGLLISAPVFEMRHWQIMMANALVLAMLGSIDALLTS